MDIKREKKSDPHLSDFVYYGGYMQDLQKRWPTLHNSFFHYFYLEENSSNCRYLKEASISTAMVPALGSIVEWKIFQSLFSRSKFSDGNISSDSSSITSTWLAFSGLSFKSSITRWFIKGNCQLVGCSLVCWLGLLDQGPPITDGRKSYEPNLT